MKAEEPQGNDSKNSVQQKMRSFRLAGDRSFKLWHWLILFGGILIIVMMSLPPSNSGSGQSGWSRGPIVPPRISDPEEPSQVEVEIKRLENQEKLDQEKTLCSHYDRFKNDLHNKCKSYQSDFDARLSDFLSDFLRFLPESEIREVFKSTLDSVAVGASGDNELRNFEEYFPEAYKIVCSKMNDLIDENDATGTVSSERLQSAIRACDSGLTRLKESVCSAEKSLVTHMDFLCQEFGNKAKTFRTLDLGTINDRIKNINELSENIQKDIEARCEAAIAIAQNIQKKVKGRLRFHLETEMLMADVTAKLDRYLRNLDALFDGFLRNLPPLEVQKAFRSAHNGVAFIASSEGLCGWKTSVQLAYKMAYDKINETNRTEEAIAPILDEYIVVHIQEALNDYSLAFSQLTDSLILEERAFSTDLMLRCVNFQEAIEGLEVLSPEKLCAINLGIENFSENIRGVAKEKCITLVGITLEAIFAKATFSIMKKVAMRVLVPAMAKVAAKAIGTLSAAGTSAAVDGPLPIGDVVGGAIAIGGVIWLAADIYNVTQTLPNEIRTTMDNHIGGLEQELKRTMEANVEILRETLKNDAVANVKDLLSEINIK